MALARAVYAFMDNPLWDYSLATYDAEDVASACLRLQDDFGMDVNLLLYAGWIARSEQALNAPHLRELDELVAEWREKAVADLSPLAEVAVGDEAIAACTEALDKRLAKAGL